LKAFPLLLLALLLPPGVCAAQEPLPTPAPSPSPAAPPTPSPSPTPAPPNITWKDGRTRLEFEHAVLNVTNRVQFRWTEQWPDELTRLSGTDAAGQSLGSFRLRRIKTKVDGWIHTPRLVFELQLNWAELGATPSNAVEDLTLDWDLSGRRLFHVRIGQMKVPFGRQVITSSMGQQFVDRAVVANEFSKGRDQGVELHGGLSKERFEWRFGIYNGNGQTKLANDNRHYQYDARLTWQPFGDPRFSEVDFESGERPLFALSAGFEHNDTHGSTTGVDTGRRVLGFDGVFKYRGLFVTTEIYRRTLDPEGLPRYRSDGWFAQGGKLFLGRRLEVAGRYGQWDPSALVSSDLRKERAVALSWYEHRHALKVQSDLRWLRDEARQTTDRELRVQAQFAF
jgi:phosphate-selective porin OprO and OprP